MSGMTRYFTSLAQFSAFAATLDLKKMVADQLARGDVATDLVHDIQDRFGKADRLPPPLAASTVDDRVAKGYSPYETLLRDGTLLNSIEWGHESPLVTGVGSTDPKSVYHELGTPKIPRRSFLAATASENNEKLFALYLATFQARFSR